MFQQSPGNKPQSGFIFIEILIALALISLAFATLLSVGFLSVKTSYDVQQETKADFLIKEELEALRTYRDATTWTGGVGGATTGSANPHYFSQSGSQWVINNGTETTDIFSRYFLLDRVSRDPSTNDIQPTYTAANDSSGTRKVTVRVTGNGHTYETVMYVTNWQNK